jgi:hypothetical protein
VACLPTCSAAGRGHGSRAAETSLAVRSDCDCEMSLTLVSGGTPPIQIGSSSARPAAMDVVGYGGRWVDGTEEPLRNASSSRIAAQRPVEDGAEGAARRPALDDPEPDSAERRTASVSGSG